MRARDFKPCLVCGKGVMHTGIPLFYRVRIERLGVLSSEVQRTAAMEQFFGGHLAIARAFHDPELTQVLMPEVTGLVCETCSTQSSMLAALVESAIDQQPKPEAA